jgi:broad specificity phosphatase PhoE
MLSISRLRKVLERAVDSIGYLAAEASKSDRARCVAVTHSTFLRILLALVSDIPLFETASMSVVNGGISVIDVPRDMKTRRLGKRAKFFGGVPTEDFALEVPICHVIRINESRHLPTATVVA